MKHSTILKSTKRIIIAIGLTTGISSCIQPQQPVTSLPQATQGSIPQGQNPYAVPGLGQQTPAPPVVSNTPAPYQPLPGVPYTPPRLEAPATIPQYTPSPIPTTPSVSGGSASVHEVVKGDTLWGISRKHGVSVESIMQENSLKNSTIWAGQKIKIPAQ